MELHGSITQNLKAAVESSRRLKGHPIHRDTLAFWSDLIREARARRSAGEGIDDREAEEAIAELESVLANA
jgi:hypothetical protein